MGNDRVLVATTYLNGQGGYVTAIRNEEGPDVRDMMGNVEAELDGYEDGTAIAAIWPQWETEGIVRYDTRASFVERMEIELTRLATSRLCGFITFSILEDSRELTLRTHWMKLDEYEDLGDWDGW